MGAERPWFEFRRTTDGLVYRFESVPGERGWKRTDLDLWCQRHGDRGWAIVDVTGTPFGWPLAGGEDSDAPPAGPWISAKDGKSYEYELIWV